MSHDLKKKVFYINRIADYGLESKNPLVKPCNCEKDLPLSPSLRNLYS